MAFEVKKVSKSFGLQNRRRRVLKNFSMQVADGEMVAIVGKKNSGKSTLMNILTGMIRPDSGTVTVDGRKINYWNPFQRAILRSKRIGLVTRDSLLVPDLTIYENLLVPMGHKFMTNKNKIRRAKEALRSVGLKGVGKYFPADLEDLEIQKVCLARAIMTHPKYLLLEEPTGNLQSADVDRYMDLVEILNSSGYTVIVLTHSRRVANHCQRLVPIAVTGEAREEREKPVEAPEEEPAEAEADEKAAKATSAAKRYEEDSAGEEEAYE